MTIVSRYSVNEIFKENVDVKFVHSKGCIFICEMRILASWKLLTTVVNEQNEGTFKGMQITGISFTK